MEGRVRPDIGEEPSGDDPPLLSSPPEPPTLPLPLPPHSDGARRSSETYVIQIPKDQVYRVPPPENAQIAERFRNNLPETKGKKSRLSRPMTVVIIVVIVCLVLGMTGLITYLILRPEGPSFSVFKVSLVSNTAKKKQPEYEISLKASNPNKRLGIDYQTNENVTLLFGGKYIAGGRFPQLYQEKNHSITVKLVLVGKEGVLPREIEKSLKETTDESKEPITLCLEMNVNMKMDLGFSKIWRMDSKASCRFKVRSLGAGSKVLSQQCQISSL